jgi:hypothetical protein
MPTLKYRAFLSYSHRDTAWAKWLHRELEAYRIDKDLVGRETAQGSVPKTLRPIFRDREDFSAGHSLNDQTVAALEASQFLIVICSPNAAQSPYVNEEIRRFKAMGGAARVIPVIVDGEPGDSRRECFPPAVRFKLGADGELTDEREEPIAADARPQGDGKEVGKQKIVAGLLGVGLDEIMRRAERARKRRNRIRMGAAGTAVFLVVGLAAGWTFAISNSSQLDSAELLIFGRNGIDLICEDIGRMAETHPLSDAQRVALAFNCVEALDVELSMEQSNGAARKIRLPQWLISRFESDIAILERSKRNGTLTEEQSKALREAQTLASRFNLQ